MIGQTISHYTIIEKLGGGGMGVVYKAHDLKLDRFVALKFLPPHLSANEEEKARFIREAKAASALDHPNICTIHEIDETADGQIFICMTYYEGETLKKQIAKGKSQVTEVIDVAIQIAQGLAKAHEKGIVHRDIKPANLFVTNDGIVKIVDFGLAMLAGQTRLTQPGMIVGTLAYMSPEQLHDVDVDVRSDIWAFGVVLYEMLTGQLPFIGEQKGEKVFSHSILNQPLLSIDLTELEHSELPAKLEQIINKALQKDRESRYQRVGEMLVDLRELKSEHQTGTTKQTRAKVSMPQRARAFLYGASVVILALLAWYLFAPSKTASTDRKSIAVLPFSNLSASQEDEFFSDGITEDILTQVSKIGDLRVISRTSIMQYKGTKKSIREIGNELNVATILEGSVRRAGNQVRIVAQLIDAGSDEHMWSETYDKEMTQIFAIQSDIAQEIAAALKAKLSPMEKERIEKRPTTSLTAYEYYLKGRDYYYRYIKQDNENAIALFKKALELDANYALAYAGLGDAYAQSFGRFGFAISWLDSAMAVSNKAIALDPNSAEAYKALGTAYAIKGWYHKCLEAFRKAIEHNPNYLPAIGNIGILYHNTGAIDEALRWYKKTVALSPTDADNYYYVGDAYRQLDDFAKAEHWLTKASELQPDYGDTYYSLALLYLGQGMDQQAMEQTKKMLTADPDGAVHIDYAGQIANFTGNFFEAKQYYQRAMAHYASIETNPRAYSPIGMGHIFWKEGNQHEARKLLNLALNPRLKEIEQGNEDIYTLYGTAAIYAIQNHKAEAYKWLQKAIEAGWRDYRINLRDPWFENLRNDDQFKQMMAQVKAKVDEMRKRVEEMDKEERL